MNSKHQNQFTLCKPFSKSFERCEQRIDLKARASVGEFDYTSILPNDVQSKQQLFERLRAEGLEETSALFNVIFERYGSTLKLRK
ncbi:hypothetical protein WBG78_26060 [Chryseolinea sp. T2]|uniref:hypothetical protein n=1 Tax=Chryseolinea sp. T2 TaxID=3129255 RepID=UPI0030779F13